MERKKSEQVISTRKLKTLEMVQTTTRKGKFSRRMDKDLPEPDTNGGDFMCTWERWCEPLKKDKKKKASSKKKKAAASSTKKKASSKKKKKPACETRKLKKGKNGGMYYMKGDRKVYCKGAASSKKKAAAPKKKASSKKKKKPACETRKLKEGKNGGMYYMKNGRKVYCKGK